ncbi:MAG: thioredoxin family protein [Myxococcota bacterium]|nr:thioredoxin family protein [Myxococcota bacterium]
MHVVSIAVFCASLVACQLTDKRPQADQPPVSLGAPDATTSRPAAASKSGTNTAKPQRVRTQRPAAKAGKTQASRQGPQPTRTSKKPVAKWPAEVEWMAWADGRRKAAAQGRPLMLVVYADWCPRCRELTPIFARPEIAALAKKLVVVKQDQDQRPKWLTGFGEYGGYVPRIFFFGADGQLRTDVTSGNARYPYFYTPRQFESLKRSMTRALEG